MSDITVEDDIAFDFVIEDRVITLKYYDSELSTVSLLFSTSKGSTLKLDDEVISGSSLNISLPIISNASESSELVRTLELVSEDGFSVLSYSLKIIYIPGFIFSTGNAENHTQPGPYVLAGYLTQKTHWESIKGYILVKPAGSDAPTDFSEYQAAPEHRIYDLKKDQAQWVLIIDLALDSSYDIYIALENDDGTEIYLGTPHSPIAQNLSTTAEDFPGEWGVKAREIQAYQGQRVIFPGAVTGGSVPYWQNPSGLDITNKYSTTDNEHYRLYSSGTINPEQYHLEVLIDGFSQGPWRFYQFRAPAPGYLQHRLDIKDSLHVSIDQNDPVLDFIDFKRDDKTITLEYYDSEISSVSLSYTISEGNTLKLDGKALPESSFVISLPDISNYTERLEMVKTLELVSGDETVLNSYSFKTVYIPPFSFSTGSAENHTQPGPYVLAGYLTQHTHWENLKGYILVKPSGADAPTDVTPYRATPPHRIYNLKKDKAQWVLLIDLVLDSSYDIYIALENTNKYIYLGAPHTPVAENLSTTAEDLPGNWGVKERVIQAYTGQKVILPGGITGGNSPSWKDPAGHNITTDYTANHGYTLHSSGTSDPSQYHLEMLTDDSSAGAWILSQSGIDLTHTLELLGTW